MGEVIVITNPIERLVIEIRGHVHDAGRAETTCAKFQLKAGLRLIELRANIEREGGDWWAFFDEKFMGYIKSRKYAEKLMKWARSDDPEGAIAAENEAARERMARVRSERSLQERTPETDETSEPDLVRKALRLVERMSTDEREQFDVAYREKYQ